MMTSRPRSSIAVRGLLACLVALLLPFLAATPARAEVAPVVQLLATPGGEPVKELPLVVAAGKAEGGVDAFLRQTGTGVLADVTLTTSVATPASVTLTGIDGAATLSIPAAPASVPVRITVAGLAEKTDVRLTIYAQGSAVGTVPIGTLHVVRDDAPALALAGGTGTDLTYSQATGAFSRLLQVVAGTTPVAATLEAASLQGEGSGVRVPLAVAVDGQPVAEGGAVTFTGNQARSVSLSATLPEVGTYAGRLVLRYGDPVSRLSLTLAVTQTTGTQSVEVRPAVKPGSVDLPLGAPGKASVDLALLEKEGRRSSLDLQVVQVTRTKGDQTGSVNASPALPVARVDLGPFQSGLVTVRLDAMPAPGLYTVTVRASNGSAPPLDIPVEIRARDSVWWAVGLILAGTVLSAGLRLWLGSARARARNRVRLDAVAATIAVLSRRAETLSVSWDEGARKLATGFFEALSGGVAAVVPRLKGAGDHDPLLTAWEQRAVLAGRWVDHLDQLARGGQAVPSASTAQLKSAQEALLAEPLDEAKYREHLEAQPIPGVNAQAVGPGPAEFAEPPTDGAWWRRVWYGGAELAVFLLLAVLATLSGLLVIYLPDLVWGGWRDRVIAFLWGMGVQQVGNVAADGIQGMRAKFAG